MLTTEPLVPLRLFKLRNVSVSQVVGALWAAAMFAWFFLAALYLQQVLGYSALEVGLAFVPTSLVMMFCSLKVSDRLVMAYGIRPPLTVGLALAGIATVLLPGRSLALRLKLLPLLLLPGLILLPLLILLLRLDVVLAPLPALVVPVPVRTASASISAVHVCPATVKLAFDHPKRLKPCAIAAVTPPRACAFAAIAAKSNGGNPGITSLRSCHRAVSHCLARGSVFAMPHRSSA